MEYFVSPFPSISLLRSSIFHWNLCFTTNQAEGSAAAYEMALTAGGITGEGCDVPSKGPQIRLACPVQQLGMQCLLLDNRHSLVKE